MFLYKCCWYVLQSQAERSRACRQISLSPDTYSSISTQKYLTKVSQTTLTHPHKHTLLHTNTLSSTRSIKAHLLLCDWLCNSVIADGGICSVKFFQFLLQKFDLQWKSSLYSLGDDEIYISLSFPWPVSLSVSWVQPRSHTSSLSSSVDLISASDDVHRFSAQVEIWHYTSVDELQAYDCS